MKRLFAAGALLLLLIGILVGGRAMTEHYANEFRGRIEQCEQEYKNGNKKSAAILAADLKADWETAHLRLSSVINRDTVDEIVLSATRLESYAATGEDNMFYCECDTFRMLLHHMLESERLSALSIF